MKYFSTYFGLTIVNSKGIELYSVIHENSFDIYCSQQVAHNKGMSTKMFIIPCIKTINN